jgi:two-component system phosphate regulon sensor histidine kinase PhoR
MIRDFVDGILTEGSEIRLERQRIDLVEFVAGVVADLAATQKVTWIHVEGERPTVVEADPRHLGRILENLLSNALKYSNAGSPIRLRIESRAGHAFLTVTDYGIGIAVDDLPRLFQRGFRTREGTRKSSGLGLGLYISRLLVEAHGGRIWAESAAGAGSTFFVELPVARVDD